MVGQTIRFDDLELGIKGTEVDDCGSRAVGTDLNNAAVVSCRGHHGLGRKSLVGHRGRTVHEDPSFVVPGSAAERVLQILGCARPGVELGPGWQAGDNVVGTKCSPLIAVRVKGQQIPTAPTVYKLLGLDHALARPPTLVCVVKAQALTRSDCPCEFDEDGGGDSSADTR